ncbi:MAG: anti-sigma factor domain-containing protein [Rhodopirellula sp. JB055]|uniref:anti-sigma factor domain-containing protein n=1 Tax=Rhodopirellula sp. JB055 TaxID=3342846 RepID=UPI003709CB89
MSERPDDLRLPRRAQELLAGKVLGDLSDQEHEEVSNWQETEADLATLFELEKTAAAVDMALSSRRSHDVAASPDAELPAGLREKIQADAGRVLAVVGETGIGSEQRADNSVTPAPLEMVEPRKPIGLRPREAAAWLAFAASALLALGLWRGSDWNGVGNTETTAAAERLLLLNEAEDVVQVAWADGKHPFQSEVTGDVVWSNESQNGYMRFVGMPMNDAAVEQYQLWIIDPARDDEPIDGGVFDIDSTGEVVVPITAKLKVLNPVAFAITVEKPGGVVVSSQENLPLLAPVP